MVVHVTADQPGGDDVFGDFWPLVGISMIGAVVLVGTVSDIVRDLRGRA